MSNPPKRITDPEFRYTPAAKTDLAATFRRIRREQERDEAAKRGEQNVRQLRTPRG